MYQVSFLLQGILGRLALILLQHKSFSLLMAIIDVKNLEKGIKNLKKPGFNPKNKKP